MKSVLFLAATLSLWSSFSLAIPENNYAQTYANQVIPFATAKMQGGSFKGVDDVEIRYAVFKNASSPNAIVISPGRTESYLQYFELAYDLFAQGFSIYMIDHRGQGLSGRMLADPQIGYVRHFSDYVTDFTTFMNSVVKPQNHRKVFLLAHSMGSPIGMFYLAENPGVFSAAVFSSPMLRIITKPYPEPVAFEIAYWLTAFGDGGKLAPGQKPYDPNSSFENNDVTHSRARWLKDHETVAANPAMALGGVSPRWVLEALRGDSVLRGMAPRLRVPMFVFEAGQDRVVVEHDEETFCARAPMCRGLFFADSYHDIFNESDEIRAPAVSTTAAFFKENSN